MKQYLISALLAACAFGLASSRINHGLRDSPLPAGPGMTLDEPLYILQGTYLFDAFCKHGPLMFTPSGADTVFGSKQYLPDHPPLGRFFLILAHEGTSWLISGAEGSPINVTAARLGSCFAFALIVFMLSEFTRRHFEITTAVLAAIGLMLMPRMVGHARLAALETTTTLAWLAAWVPLWMWWTKDRPPTTRQSFFSGLLWGMLMLTKVQGILLPPLIVLWALWRFKLRALRPLVVWGFTGAVVFFLGWPWLWLDPVGNTLQYLGQAAERPTLYVWYFGERFMDKEVPWHYPFVITAITVPLLVFGFFILRLCQRRLERNEQLILASAVWPLCLFALPGTPVYDGSRLFLVIMPAVAMLAARGLVRLATHLTPRRARTCWVTVGLLALLSVPDVLQPFALNNYSWLAGTASGAEKLGMEAGYWADGLNGNFWDQVPMDAEIFVAPVSHQVQLNAMASFVPAAAARRVRLQPFLYDPEKQRGLILLIHRLADLPPQLRSIPKGAKVIAESRLDGVVLCRLIDTTQATWPERPHWPGE